MDGSTALLSVVIPAHDEGRVVARCLDALRPLLADGRAEVVLVANGCTDDTAAVARTVDGVTVLELAEAGKPGALNAGDAAATVFPRVYLDADVEVDAETLLALGAALPAGEALVGAPTVRFELDGRPWAVRAYFTVFSRLPYARSGLVGLGVYALSAAGRGRFAAFPALTADDLFVQRHFAPGERRVLPGHVFTVHPPMTLAALIRVRSRVAAGNSELAAELTGAPKLDPDPGRMRPDLAPNLGVGFDATTAGTGSALLALVRASPGLAPAAAVYLLVTAVARVRARRSGSRWERDDTTR